MSYKLLKSGVLRLADNASIPPTMDNLDWVAYQKWLSVPNTPQPADPEPAPVDQSDLDLIDKRMKALAMCVAQVGGITPAQMKALFKQKFDSLP